MTDIMEHWRNNRFVIADNDLIDFEDGNIIILTDVTYWNEHYEELRLWCKLYGAEIRGMTVTCNDQTVTAFALRWS
jgi:hypothetical protein